MSHLIRRLRKARARAAAFPAAAASPIVAAAVLVVLSGAPATAQDLSAWRIVDLTHPFDSTTVYWPTAPQGFELEEISRGETEGGWWYEAHAFSAPEHGGTHLDAPVHFARGAWDAASIPLERLIGPAIVIDVSGKAARNPDYRLSAEDVRAWETEHGRVPEGAIVLLRTGWSERWPDREAYLGDDTPGDASDLHFPSFGEAAARLLVHERGIAVLGADVASIDYGPSESFPVHRLAGKANVPGLENLMNLDQLPPTGAFVIALPIKIAGGSGGPLRAVALLPPEPAP